MSSEKFVYDEEFVCGLYNQVIDVTDEMIAGKKDADTERAHNLLLETDDYNQHRPAEIEHVVPELLIFELMVRYNAALKPALDAGHYNPLYARIRYGQICEAVKNNDEKLANNLTKDAIRYDRFRDKMTQTHPDPGMEALEKYCQEGTVVHISVFSHYIPDLNKFTYPFQIGDKLPPETGFEKSLRQQRERNRLSSKGIDSPRSNDSIAQASSTSSSSSPRTSDYNYTQQTSPSRSHVERQSKRKGLFACFGR